MKELEKVRKVESVIYRDLRDDESDDGGGSGVFTRELA
jgi:hypothetical protein